MRAEAGLSSLLAALREAGLGVGVSEVARLQAVFTRQPELPAAEDAARSRLGGLLAAVLVKSREDQQIFERVFAAWFERTEEEVRQRSAPQRPQIEPEPRALGTKKRIRKPWWSAATAVLILIVGLSIEWDTQWSPQAVPAPPPPPKSEVQPTDLSRPPTAAEIRKRRFTSWVPVLVVTPGTPIWTGWPALGMGLLALVAGGGIWGRYRGRRWVPERTPEPSLPGPPRVFLTPPPLRGAQLLTQRQQEMLVWGIGRYVSEESTRRLDLPATVHATAQASGLPDLRFERAGFSREVWLWTDESADDLALPRLADEVEALLCSYGLPVERAVFRGIPDRLVTAEGQAFAPSEVDERRDVALVAVLTDGRLLSHQWAAADRRVRVDVLLRGLSFWPRLAFVDFSDGDTALPHALARHSIPLLDPGELTGFLGGAAIPMPGAGAAEGEIAGRSGDLAWAAVCALGPAPVAEETAFELRERLGLSTSPWALRALRKEAPGPPGRLQWKPLDRAQRLRWLLGAEEHPADRVDPRSLLGRALDLWEEIYDRELASRGQEAGAVPWQGTPAEEHLRLERALLRLWRHPKAAARDLYPLYRGALAESIRQYLAGHAPVGCGREGRVELPWRWEALSPVSQVMLQEMGFAEGALPRLVFGRSSRLRLGVGLGLGLGLGALGMAMASGVGRPAGRPRVSHSPGKPADAWESLVLAPLTPNWVVTVATRKWSKTEFVAPGSLVTVRWEHRKGRCVEPLVNGTEVWRCGSLIEPPALSPEIPRSVVVLRTHPGDKEVEDLTLALLDSGSADTVIVDKRAGFEVANVSEAGGQVLILVGYLPGPVMAIPKIIPLEIHSGFTVARIVYWVLTAALHDFNGGTVRSIQDVLWPGIQDLAGDSQNVLLRGLGDTGCRPFEETDSNGLDFVRICPGSFQMGSPVNDPIASDNEKPAHKVTMSEFWLGEYEITNGEYRLFQPDHPGTNGLPATNVSWEEAKAFCEHFGYRLPTEAQWEYACRAGTQTRWSFGDDEGQLREYAWFGGRLEPQPVGTRQPNPWGLYDMHGNAWEWVADWYGPYSAGPQTDPTGPLEGKYRVLRGGSFSVSSKFLRSANRNRFKPVIRISNMGFRCARGPRRQALTPGPSSGPPTRTAGRGE